jgi:TetR/AcrR family transcriptional repressor of lmrAB and yxaGH operons
MPGYFETVLNQITKESGAAKGSLYYHSPEGEGQFTTAADRRIAQTIAERILISLGAIDHSGEPIGQCMLRVADDVGATRFIKEVGITTIALESITTNERTREACKDT